MTLLPDDAAAARPIGRIYDPEAGAPCLVQLCRDRLVDVATAGPTLSALLEGDDPAGRAAVPDVRGWDARQGNSPHLLAPCDLQAIRACGVTFAGSMVERVIDERAKGDLVRAALLRPQLADTIDSRLGKLRPGSLEAMRAKQALIAEGLWSHCLEVGIGSGAELFTRAPGLSAVGAGAAIGILAALSWNDPEPEVVVLAVDA